MTLYQRKNNTEGYSGVSLRNEAYLIINIFFAGVIMLVIVYSGIFSPEHDSYPVACFHKKLTGVPCASCGLSHSFSLIVRGRIDEAYQWNANAMRVFLFFASQLVLRVVFSLFYIKFPSTRRQLIITDCTGSVLLFLIAFWPFIVSIVFGVVSQT
jgi:hypothetical protein